MRNLGHKEYNIFQEPWVIKGNYDGSLGDTPVRLSDNSIYYRVYRGSAGGGNSLIRSTYMYDLTNYKQLKITASNTGNTGSVGYTMTTDAKGDVTKIGNYGNGVTTFDLTSHPVTNVYLVLYCMTGSAGTGYSTVNNIELIK